MAESKPPSFEVVREPYGVLHQDPSPIKDVYGGDPGYVFVECMRIRPATVESGTVIVFSHPIGGGSFLPLVNSLAAAGVLPPPELFRRAWPRVWPGRATRPRPATSTLSPSFSVAARENHQVSVVLVIYWGDDFADAFGKSRLTMYKNRYISPERKSDF